MVLRLVGTVSILVSTILTASLAIAQVQTITATHTYVMGDSDSKEQARALCYMTAKRKVLDKAGVFIESSTEISNFKLSNDQINSYSAAILSVEVVKEEFGFANGVNTLTLTVNAKADIEDVRKRLVEIVSNKGLQTKVDAQQQQIRHLEQQVQALSEKLRGTMTDTTEEIRKVRDMDLVAYSHFWAERGDTASQSYLGFAYFKGEGVPQDFIHAAVWFRKAAEQGHAQAQFSLGLQYEVGKGVPQDYAQAVVWYRKAAEQGVDMAQYCLGEAYSHGNGVPLDYVQAALWYRKAAEQGHPEPQFSLAQLYHMGHGVPQDYAQAATWYRKAANQGHTEAQFVLGLLYGSGSGVPQDSVRSAAWYRKAAEQGHAEAQYSLGARYLLGIGVPKDYVQAYKWINLAAGKDHRKAIEDRTALENDPRLSPLELAEAQRLTREWQRSFEVRQEKK